MKRILKDKLYGRLIIIISIVIVLLVICYVLILSKPCIVIDSITVESLGLQLDESHPKYMEGKNPVETVEYMLQEGREKGYDDIQVFIKSKQLPSYDANDYAKVTITFSAINMTIFDDWCSSLLVNNYDLSSDILVVTFPNIKPYEFNRLSTTDELEYRLFIYTKGKTHEEIEKVIKSIEFQVPFTNDIANNSNVYFNIDDVNIEFNGL